MYKRIYIYPITARGTDESGNPYIKNLVKSLSDRYLIINKDKPSNNGIIQLYQLFFKTDIVFFNWIENLPERKAGFIQTLLLLSILRIFKISGKKVLWTMHNKVSHTHTKIKLKQYVFSRLLKLSDFIITHSTEGINYGKEMGGKNNIRYFPHPVVMSEIKEAKNNADKVYDVLIWGLMTPYKGLSRFLKFLKENNINHFSILIAGKFVSDDYYKEVLAYKTDKINIINRFIEKDELEIFMNQSKVVLFTYQDSTVLSSGVLMDTLAHGATILGPTTGSFSDFAKEGLLFTYKDFGELTGLIQKILKKEISINQNKISEFLKNITWERYVEFLETKFLN
jgi:beta-1,4-mannosyltransferase